MSAISTDRLPVGTYTIDSAHSNVGFEIKHMGIATVRGKFRSFEGTVDATGDAPRLEGVVQVSSVDTGEESRDGHLQAPDMFDAARHPEIRFHSTATEITGGGRISLSGEITIKGVTKPIELTGQIAEGGEDPWGKQRVGFEVSATIDRRDFDVKWNQTLPNGNLLVANDVKLLVSVSAVKAG
jgi:polyisoprenoid-binding protein YceI